MTSGPVDLAILTVIPAELDAAKAALDVTDNGYEKTPDGTIYHRTSVFSKRSNRPLHVVLGCIGDAGNSGSAAATMHVIQRFHPRAVLLMGIAAGLRNKTRIGEVVLSERVVAYESAAVVVPDGTRRPAWRRILDWATNAKTPIVTEPRADTHKLPHTLNQDVVNYKGNSSQLMAIFQKIGGVFPHAPSEKQAEYEKHVATTIMARPATIASGEKLLKHPDFLLAVRRTIHGKVEVGEMEAAGFAEACRRENIPWLVVRGISDFGDTLKDDAFHSFASHAAAAVLLDFLERGIDLGGGTPDPDIEKLKAYSAHIATSLLRNESFVALRHTVSIARDCEPAIERLASMGSVLITGEPGAGKSAVMSRFARKQRETGRDVLVLRADDLPDGPSELNTRLGLQSTVPMILQRWSGSTPGYVIIDALDVARSDKSTNGFRTLIEQIQTIIRDSNGSRWHVIASIREYELRNSQKLGALFAASATDAFLGNRHVRVGPMSDTELRTMLDQSQPLAHLYSVAGARAQELMHNPFNMTLAADILDSGESAESLREVQTQVELLSRYWIARVAHPEHGPAREALLRTIVTRMVEQGVMHLRKVDCEHMRDFAMLSDLLRERVLVEPPSHDSQIFIFPHQILFDAAVERLLLRGTVLDTARLLNSKPDLSITIRPSIFMHYHYLWWRAESISNPSKDDFWASSTAVAQQADIPQTGKIIGPLVAAELFTSMDQLKPLVDAVCGRELDRRDAAAFLLSQMILARDASGLPNPVTGGNAKPWCHLAQTMAASLRCIAGSPQATDFIQGLVNLLREATTDPDWAGDQLRASGEASRLLLAFMLQPPFNPSNLRLAVTPVCRTIASDPSATRAALAPVLAAAPDHGFMTLPYIAHDINIIMQASPELAEDIYKVTFSFSETRNARTSLGNGVVSLSSNIAQDYNGARWSLSEQFAGFLQRSPLSAVRALLIAARALIDEHHVAREVGTDENHKHFVLNGHSTGIRADGSSVWDRGDGTRGYDALPMMNDFESFLASLCEPPSDTATCSAVVDLVTSEPRSAIWWRRLLSVARRFPSTLGIKLKELAWTVEVLVCHDTVYDVGEFITVIYPLLDQGDRARIDYAILSVTTVSPDDTILLLPKVQSRLLGCIPSSLVATPEAIAARQDLETAAQLAPNRPLFHFSGMTVSDYTEDDSLSDEGVALDATRTIEIRRLLSPVKDYLGAHASNDPLNDLSEPIRLIDLLYARLHAEQANQEDALMRTAWSSLAELSARVAESPFVVAPDSYALVKRILFEASIKPWPVPSPQEDSMLVSVGARFYAAEGLSALFRSGRGTDGAALERIELLARDPERSIRLTLARDVGAIWKLAPSRAWSLFEEYIKKEDKASVLGALFTASGPIAQDRPSDVAKAVRGVFEQWHGKPNDDRVCTPAVRLALWLWLDFNQADGEAIVRSLVDTPSVAKDAIHSLIVGMRDTLTAGAVAPPDPRMDRWRTASFGIMRQIAASCLQAIGSAVEQSKLTASDDEIDQLRESASTCARHIETLAAELHFGSGAYDAEQNRGDLESRRTPAVKKRFWHESKDLIRDVSAFGYPSATHDLVLTLSFLADAAPEEVLPFLAEIVKASPVNYTRDEMAMRAVFKLLRLYVADYRSLLLVPGPCRSALLEINDIFAKAGHKEPVLFAQEIAAELR